MKPLNKNLGSSYYKTYHPQPYQANANNIIHLGTTTTWIIRLF